MSGELPLWPPLLTLLLAAIAFIVLWQYGRRLDRQAEEEKRRAAE
jgi:hypothetical protein